MAFAISDDLSQLLQRPVGGGFVVTLTCASRRVRADDDEHVQHPKRRGDSHEEVAGKDRRRMIFQERGPALIAARLAWPLLRHVFANRSWRDSRAS